MKHKNIQTTTYKLTILFTVSLFGIIFILGATFFTFRYFQSYNIDKKIFETTAIQRLQDISKQDDILDFFGLDIWEEKVEDFFKPNGGNRRVWPLLKPWSFFIVSNSWKILDKNIKEQADFEEILEIRPWKTLLHDGVFMRSELIEYF